jgi:hypothetical protein
MKPRLDSLQWLAERVEKEAPFVGYQAAVALRAATRALPQFKAELMNAVDRAMRALGDKRDTDRFEELERAKREIESLSE